MKNSHIQWTDSTWNPWEGCTKVSPGCLNCYAETRNARFGGGTAPNWGAGKPRRRTSPDNWREPVRWNRAAMALAAEDSLLTLDRRRPRVFCASLADWLDAEVPIEWLADMLTLVFDCGFLDWQLLTKRPENFKTRLLAAVAFILNHRDPTERNHAIAGWIQEWVDGTPPHNVWLGVSVEDQLRADLRVPILLALPTKVRFLSCEPLLGPIKLTLRANSARAISWVILGGESGFRGVRKLDVAWLEDLLKQCREAGVPAFVKQLGARPFTFFDPSHAGVRAFKNQTDDVPPRWEWHWQIRHPKGGEPSEWPESLRVFEFPGGAT